MEVRRALVARAVFKTVERGEKLLWQVRFLCTSAITIQKASPFPEAPFVFITNLLLLLYVLNQFNGLLSKLQDHGRNYSRDH